MVSFVNESIKFIKQHLHDILLVSLGILIYVIIKTKYLKENPQDNISITNKTIKKEIVVENMDVREEEKDNEHEEIADNMSANFCKTLQGKSHEIEEKCSIQTDGACKALSCCVLASTKGDKQAKCLAGSKVGPTYHTDENGNNLNFEYYYYQNKCYGSGCPQKTN